jgi:hypothetical protein
VSTAVTSVLCAYTNKFGDQVQRDAGDSFCTSRYERLE